MISLLKKYRIILLPLLGLYGWLITSIAWVSDDAFITFRSIENFLKGYGPVFNIGERVQTFTHPLWFLLQSLVNLVLNWWKNNPLGSGQLFYVNILASIGISIITLLILSFGISRSTRGAILGILILSMSKAFLDYSTSGLENPLTHLILAAFLWIYLSFETRNKSVVFILSGLAALGGLNRLDTFLFFLPALCWLLWKSEKKGNTLLLMGGGFSPLIIWEIFSIFYYGTPFPNTAYAKINTGIATMDLIQQGWFYYLNSLRLDPITLLVIFIATIWGLTNKNTSLKMVALGNLLYLLYILKIGGDFMSGRFFSPVLFVSVAQLARVEYSSLKWYIPALLMVLIVGVGAYYLIPERKPNFGRGAGSYRVFLDANDISDERMVYRRQNFLLALEKGAPKAPFTRGTWIHHANEPVQVELVGPLGMASHRLGPDVHVIDLNALADPLMSRMPLQDPTHWRIGHFRHVIPDGYLETLSSGKNVIADKNIALFYDKLSIVVKGKLWSWKRLVEIWNLNTGRYNYLLEHLDDNQG